MRAVRRIQYLERQLVATTTAHGHALQGWKHLLAEPHLLAWLLNRSLGPHWQVKADASVNSKNKTCGEDKT